MVAGRGIHGRGKRKDFIGCAGNLRGREHEESGWRGCRENTKRMTGKVGFLWQDRNLVQSIIPGIYKGDSSYNS